MKPSAIVTTYEQRLWLHSEAYVKMNNKNKNLTSQWNHSAPQLPSLGIWNLCPGRQRSRADIHPVSHVGKSTCQHGRRGRGRTDGGERQEDSRRGGMIIEGRERERRGERRGEWKVLWPHEGRMKGEVAAEMKEKGWRGGWRTVRPVGIHKRPGL